MKKLMVALSATVLAVTLNAANFSWSTGTQVINNGYLNPGTSTSYDGKAAVSGLTCYLIESSLSGADLLEAIKGGASLSSKAIAGTAGVTDSAGKVTSANAIKFSVDMAVGETLDVYLAALSADGKYLYISGNKTGSAQLADTTPLSFATTGTSAKMAASAGGTGWNAVNVPEPTSGLLLLIGVAGMALRRRHA